MPVQQNQDWLSCPVCFNSYNELKYQPLSLGCGHVVCKSCLVNLDTGKCPLDQSVLPISVHHLPVNNGLLAVMGYDRVRNQEVTIGWRSLIGSDNMDMYERVVAVLEKLGSYLVGWIRGECGDDHSGCDNSPLTKPMQRKLLSLISCQVAEPDGRVRVCKCARSIGERIVCELILHHQQHQQLSAYLWAAVRARGCQFLGPAMQEEVLKLILLALKSGESMSRKSLVLHVVQHLEKQFPHASKTAIGHVVQLLYRASCFKVTKRDDQSSLMQLKEEFCTYDNLRREHDNQIVQIATEAGLRIAPEQWSSLLYGDSVHKSHMQSIIDKLQSPQSFSQSINEFLIALQRSSDPFGLSILRPQLDLLAAIDASYESAPIPSWTALLTIVEAVWIVVQKFAEFVQTNQKKSADPGSQQTKFKTSMCRDFSQRGICPRGNSCTFAHSVEEMERFRARSRRARTLGQGHVPVPVQGQGEGRFGKGALDLTPEIVTGSNLIPPNTSGFAGMDVRTRSTLTISSISSSGGARSYSTTTPRPGMSAITSLVSSPGASLVSSPSVSLVSSLGTVSRSSVVPPPSTASLHKQIANSSTSKLCTGYSPSTVVASTLGKSTNTASESRYGQHRRQQSVVRCGSAYQERQFSGEHLASVHEYQPSLPAQLYPPPTQLDHKDLQDGARQCKVMRAQLGSQPLVNPQQNFPLKVTESLPLLQLRNQSLLHNLYRRREELLTNLGPAVNANIRIGLPRTTLATGHVCSGCHVGHSMRCCASGYRDSDHRLPANVMTPGLHADRLLNRTRTFTAEELCRSVSDSAVSMQATARVDQVLEDSPDCGSEDDLGDWEPIQAAVAATIAESDSDFEEGDVSDTPWDDPPYWSGSVTSMDGLVHSCIPGLPCEASIPPEALGEALLPPEALLPSEVLQEAVLEPQTLVPSEVLHSDSEALLPDDVLLSDDVLPSEACLGSEALVVGDTGTSPKSDEPDVLWLPDGDDEEIPFVPFDPPFVSKYGPISRAARMKVTKNTAPRVVDALRNSGPTPVTAVTPSSRPHMTAYHTSSPAQMIPGTRDPFGVAIANSLPTANIKVDQMVGTSPGSCSEPHTLWSLRQSELESQGLPAHVVGSHPHSIAEREQLKHELDLLDQQIQLVSQDEQLARQLQQLEHSLQQAEPLEGRCVSSPRVVVMTMPSAGAHASMGPSSVGPLPPRYGPPRAPPTTGEVLFPTGMGSGFNVAFTNGKRP